MNFRPVYYHTSVFDNYRPFDIVPYDNVVKDFMKVVNELDSRSIHTSGWNKRPIDSSKDKIYKGEFWSGYDPYYHLVDSNDGVGPVVAKADVISMDMRGVGTSWTHFIYFTLPHELINNYMNAMHDNVDTNILKKFIHEVNNSDKGWDVDNYTSLMEEYDRMYPEKTSYTDFFQTHTQFKWRQDFKPQEYVSIKNTGLIYPIVYDSTSFMLKRGTHRATYLALCNSDVPVFLQYPNTTLDTNIVYEITTPSHFGGYPLKAVVDVANKKINYYINNKLVL